MELSDPSLVSKTPAFLAFAISSEAVVEPRQHPCLVDLPRSFLDAVRLVTDVADAFIGEEV